MVDIALKTRIYSNLELDEDIYHADRNFVSSSGLKLLPNRIDEFIAKYHMQHKRPAQTEAKAFGKALHCAVLEPDMFPVKYMAAPPCDKRTKDGKEEFAAFCAEAKKAGAAVITADEMEVLRSMRDSVHQHPVAGKALINASRETSFFHVGQDINQKVRLDAYKAGIILDVKSTDDMGRFFTYAVKYGYHISEAMYRSVVANVTGTKPEFLFVAIQKSYPYTVAVFQSDAEMRADGERRYQAAKDTYISLRASNGWGGIRTMSLPQWAKDTPDLSTIEEF